MDSAFAWLQNITDWLARFVPRWTIIDPTVEAVYYVRGGQVVVKKAGVHWHWPLWTDCHVYPVVRQTDRLESQTMETADGITFMVSGTLTYVVDDIEKLLPTTHNPTATVVDIAMASVHDVCCAFETYAALQAAQRHATKLKTLLRNTAQSQLAEYGVKVIKLQLNSLARCRVLKVSQSVSQEEN